MKEFNLIITSKRRNEIKCEKEFLVLSNILGLENVEIERTKFSGVIICKIEEDPLNFIKRAKKVIEEDPWSFRYIQRIIPIQRVCEINKIKDIVKDFQIPKDSTFKIIVNKRGSNIKSKEIIEDIASIINRKVDLENPDFIINVEIIEDIVGLSLIKEEDIISIPKLQEKILSSEIE